MSSRTRGSVGFTIDAKEFIGALKRAPKVFKRESKKAMKEIGQLVAYHAQKKCPRAGWKGIMQQRLPWFVIQKLNAIGWKNTGFLRKTIRVVDVKWNRVVIAAGSSATQAGKWNYAKLVHQGTRYMLPRPFMTHGIQMARGDAHTLIRRAVNATLMSLRGS